MDLLSERGLPVDLLRVRAFPFGADVEAFLRQHDIVFVVDQNRDGQLRTLLVNDTGIEKARLKSVRHYSGTPLSADHVLEEVLPVLAPDSQGSGRPSLAATEPPRLQA